jgi:hypothetical protein
VVGERPVVDVDPRRFVDTRDERARREVGGNPGRQRAAHLAELASDGESQAVRQIGVVVRRLEHPPMDRPATGGADDVEGGGEEAGADRLGLIATGGVDDELHRGGVVARRDGRQPNRLVAVARGDRGEPVSAAGPEVEAELVGERRSTVGALGRGQQTVDGADVIGSRVTQHIEPEHVPNVPAHTELSFSFGRIGPVLNDSSGWGASVGSTRS